MRVLVARRRGPGGKRQTTCQAHSDSPGGGVPLLEGESRGGELAARSRLLDDLRLDFLICSVP